MATKPNPEKKKTDSIIDTEKEVDVLYQKLGDQWFAFSVVDDEVFVGPVGTSDLPITNKDIGHGKG